MTIAAAFEHSWALGWKAKIIGFLVLRQIRDLKMTANGVYAMSAVTALTAQNTTGVQGIMAVPADFLKAQIDSCVTDIFPDSVKIGMVAQSDLIRVIAERLKFYGIKNTTFL